MPDGAEDEARIARGAAGPPGIPEGLKGSPEAYFMYPIEGKDLIDEIRDAAKEKDLEKRIKRFSRAVSEAVAFREGLQFGTRDYELGKDNPEIILDLQNRFTSAEGGIERPSPWYLDAAIREQINTRVRKIKQDARERPPSERGLTDDERKEIAQLMRIENQREGRKTIDAAFVQRMLACENWETVAALLSKDPRFSLSIKPDRGHWQGALWGEFGEKVDRVLRRIVAAGMDEKQLERSRNRAIRNLKNRVKKEGLSQREVDEQIRYLNEDLKPVPELKIKDKIYARGFVEGGDFEKWLAHLLEATDDGEMDVVWFAWRLALLWELPCQFGCKKVYNKAYKKWEWKIADPPLGNDLHTWTTHLPKKRALEWGWDVNNQRGPRGAKYLTHSGYPISLGETAWRVKDKKDERIVKIPKIGSLCESFLHESKIEIPKEAKEKREKGETERVSLWRLWWERGMKLGGHFDDEKAAKNILPWALTEAQPRGLDTEELPPGSFGFWYLTRFRASKVLEDIRSRPTLRDLSDPDFFAQKLRNWEKVLGVVKEDLPASQNPRAWWVAGILIHSHLKKTEDIPLIKNEPEKAYKTRHPEGLWSATYMGKRERRAISVWEVLNHAYQCGFLREVDIDWLVEQLAIPKPPGGAKAY